MPRRWRRGTSTIQTEDAVHNLSEGNKLPGFAIGRIGNRWVTDAGINEWADTNELVVVYLDTIASSASGPTNPNACFDWWGYSNQYGPNYALRSGLQMSVLYAMVQRVTGRP